jgi:hypothetical protein
MKTKLLSILLLAGTLVGTVDAQQGQRRGGNGGNGGNGFYQDLPTDTQDKLAALRGTHQAERDRKSVV